MKISRLSGSCIWLVDSASNQRKIMSKLNRITSTAIVTAALLTVTLNNQASAHDYYAAGWEKAVTSYTSWTCLDKFTRQPDDCNKCSGSLILPSTRGMIKRIRPLGHPKLHSMEIRRSTSAHQRGRLLPAPPSTRVQAGQVLGAKAIVKISKPPSTSSIALPTMNVLESTTALRPTSKSPERGFRHIRSQGAMGIRRLQVTLEPKSAT